MAAGVRAIIARRSVIEPGRLDMSAETRALVLSALTAAALGSLGMVTALASDSQAILLDGLFNLAYVLTALFALHVSRLAARPDDERFPFGYGYFEPLVNAVKGLLILGISLFALYQALVALASGGRAIALGPAIGYAVVATLTCAALAFALSRMRVDSPLVRADVENWTVNAAISASVLLAFCAIPVLERLDRPAAVPYVDPLAVALVILLTFAIPVRMSWRALNALLNRAPPPSVLDPLVAEVNEALTDVPARCVYVRAVQPGRALYVAVHVLLAEDAVGLDVAAADALRHRIAASLGRTRSQAVIDVLFTAEPIFAAPSAGFLPRHPADG